MKRKLPGFALDAAFATDGGILSVMGPSGSGKTMTLRCIAGLVHPDSGHVAAGGRTLFNSATGINLAPQARRVGFVFQDYALFPHMTIGKNIAYGLQRLLNIDKDARVAWLLDMMKISALADRYPGQISSGQQQRVALARALATDPELLLLDEPFSALDAVTRTELEAEMIAVRGGFRGSIVFVTHDFAQAYRLGSRIAVYNSGRVEQCDQRDRLIESPASPTVAALVGYRTLTAGRIVSRTGSDALVSVPSWGCDVRVSAPGYRMLPTQRVVIGTRPEDVRLAEGPGENVIAVSLRRVIEEPGSFDCLFACAAEGALGVISATLPKPHTVTLREGQPCRLFLPPGKLAVIPESGPPSLGG